MEESHISPDKALRILSKKKHSLLGLWNCIEAEIEQYSNAPEDDTTLADTRGYIELFHNFDKSSDIFRYPANRKLEIFFIKPQTFDMLNIAACFHELCNFIDAVASMLGDVKSMEAEMWSYYPDDMYDYGY